jgi:ABC-2 type transport system permease protein
MFLVLPAVITGFFMAMLVLALLASKTDLIDIRIDMSEEYSDRFEGQKIGSDEAFELLLLRMERLDVAEREQYLRSGLHSLGSPLFIVLWFVMVIYLLDTLYQDRRDRSILFWKSMPVSDTMTVVSKLLTVLLMVPLIYIACAAALQLFSLILLTMVSVGTDVSVWDHIWAPAGILSAWVRYVGVLLFYVFWALPFFGWLLVVSGFAKSVPLIWATGIPMGLMIVEALFTEQEGLRDWIKLHMLPMNMLKQGGSLLDSLMQMALSLQMVSALVVGGALIVVAIWLRGRADEI